MRNVLAIARRELGAYFDSPLAYVIVTIYAVLVGGFALWFDDVFAAGVVSLRSVFFWSALFLVLLVPAVTMRLFAEEYRTGSIELLATFPITEGELVLGKWLAAVSLVGIGILATLSYALTLAVLGVPEGAGAGNFLVRLVNESGLDPGEVACGYLGLLLLGAAIAGLGTAASALTNSQIVAFLGALVVSLFPFALGSFLDKVPAGLVPLAQFLALNTHFNNLARGVIDLRDLVYCGSVAALGLHVAVYALERRRLG
ncbi:MAG: ABC transporter permease [Deltaproteobacteria bacterium]|nr:ABC transporter permease [Deltaproteobacteria bacterium]